MELRYYRATVYGSRLLEAAEFPIGKTGPENEKKQVLAKAMFDSFSLDNRRTIRDHFEGKEAMEPATLSKYIVLAKYWAALWKAGWSLRETEAMVAILTRLNKKQRQISIRHWLMGRASPAITDVLAFAQSISDKPQKSKPRKAAKDQVVFDFYPDYLPDWARKLHDNWNGRDKYITLGDHRFLLLGLAKELLELVSQDEGFSREGSFPMASLKSLCEMIASRHFHRDGDNAVTGKLALAMSLHYRINILVREGPRQHSTDDKRHSWYCLSLLGQYLLDELRRTKGGHT